MQEFTILAYFSDNTDPDIIGAKTLEAAIESAQWEMEGENAQYALVYDGAHVEVHQEFSVSPDSVY